MAASEDTVVMDDSMYARLDASEVRGRHVRAARVLLDWTKAVAARECGVGVNTLGRFEDDLGSITARTAHDIVRRFEEEGILFVRIAGSSGVLMRETESDDFLHRPASR